MCGLLSLTTGFLGFLCGLHLVHTRYCRGPQPAESTGMTAHCSIRNDTGVLVGVPVVRCTWVTVE